MDGEQTLGAYSLEQVVKGERLPEILSTIHNEVQEIEGLRLNTVLLGLEETYKNVTAKTNRRVAVLGSMAMYAHFQQLRSDGRELMILEQRIAGGKNDMDIAVAQSDREMIMEDFGWGESDKSKKRGFVGEKGLKVDVLARAEKPHFPYVRVAVRSQEMFVQSAEEMIFEKMEALIGMWSPENYGFGEAKWGVDIKLLKAYLMESRHWDEVQLEEYLAQRFEEYQEDKRYEGVRVIVNEVRSGKTIAEAVTGYLKPRVFGEIGDVRHEMVKLVGEENRELVNAVFESEGAVQLADSLKRLIDLKAPVRMSYAAATDRAAKQYMSILSANMS